MEDPWGSDHVLLETFAHRNIWYFAKAEFNIVLPRRRNSVSESIEVVVMLRKDDMAELEHSAVWSYWTEASSPNE
jgi:hypothetical protein